MTDKLPPPADVKHELRELMQAADKLVVAYMHSALVPQVLPWTTSPAPTTRVYGTLTRIRKRGYGPCPQESEQYEQAFGARDRNTSVESRYRDWVWRRLRVLNRRDDNRERGFPRRTLRRRS